MNRQESIIHNLHWPLESVDLNISFAAGAQIGERVYLLTKWPAATRSPPMCFSKRSVNAKFSERRHYLPSCSWNCTGYAAISLERKRYEAFHLSNIVLIHQTLTVQNTAFLTEYTEHAQKSLSCVSMCFSTFYSSKNPGKM